jgi:hypothetical protein
MEIRYSTFINRLGKRLFGERPSSACEVPPAANEEIPRYPPFMKGLPAAPVERILSTQTELIQAIEQALALPDDLYQTIALPVIARYAAFSHLLPASESHHHRGAGGLFRHGLEVAHWATMASQGCLFATHATPRERKAQELRWRLAVCFAGLLHDIGKPVSDMAVVDRQGQHTWNPCDENLTDWAAQNQIDRYFLRWRENRHKRHEQFSALVIERVLTRPSRSYILEPGPDIMQAMLETIHGLDRGTKLYELVVSADCKSVERDLKAHHHTMDSTMGMPVEKYLFDAMRRLIKAGQWRVNEKGARVWRFKEGIHIVWRSGAQDIVSMLAKDKVPGIPRDEDTLADILIERGLAIPKSLPGGRKYRYWRMQPQGMDAALYLLRLASIELIYSNEPPVVVEGIEIGEAIETEVEPKIATVAKLQATLPNKPIEVAVTAKSLTDETEKLAIATAEIPDGKDTAIVTKDSKTVKAAQVKSNAMIESAASSEVNLVLENTVTANTSTNNPAQTTMIEGESNPVVKAKSNQQSQPDEQKNAFPAEIEQVAAHESQLPARKWLQDQGLAGEWLLQLISEINTGRWHWGVELLESQDKCLLPFPGLAEKLNVESNHFIKTLEEKGWLVTDVLSPMRKVQTINQVRGVLLAAEPSDKIKQLLTVAELTTAIDKSAHQPEKTETQLYETEPLPKKTEAQGKKRNSKANWLKNQPQGIENQKLNANTDYLEQSQEYEITNVTPAVIEASIESAIHQNQPSSKSSPSRIVSARTVITGKIDYPQAIKALITHIQASQPVSQSVAPLSAQDSEWCFISDAAIDQYLDENPNLQRTRFMLEISQYPECHNLGLRKGVKVRIKP